MGKQSTMKILLVSALRDEGPHLLEWVAHHRALGVTDFLLFSNDCSDGTDAMLDALAPMGVVHLSNTPPQGKSLQWNALHQAWGHDLRKAADWIMCIDTDEFINTTETFTHAAPEGCNYPVGARQFKTLFRAKGPFRQIGVHRPRLKKNAVAHWVNASGQPMPDGFDRAEHRISLFGMSAATELVQLNHYSVRSAQSFMLKRERGLPNRKGKALDMTYWVERNFNTVEDRSIEGLLPATKAELARMMAVPGMAELHEGALVHHHQRFAEIMQDRANVRLFGRLLLAASSVPLEDALIGDMVARYRNAHD